MSTPELILVCVVAFGASWLTLISGFGLGTLLLPAFILFFDPIEAVMMTAIVHLLNNIFKFSLLFKSINGKVLLWFGVPGIAGALLGSNLATSLDESIAYTSKFGGSYSEVTWFSVAVGILMILFALQELLFGRFSFKTKPAVLLPGGVVSGFFGGLTGHQGALRSMFLLKSGLTSLGYVATGTAIALLIDLTRIPVYLSSMDTAVLTNVWQELTFATLSAFIGAYIGKRMMKKVTFRAVQWVVGILMILIGLALIFGLI
ncbi:sulfite exporter TauE/SafE family protein [Phaeocystidibacter luteus]|uniref:Probable membrane transporter protein n=1 Tax=Phaeocystidibacter luteus TaxID=911197 RepID=A0A6N6RJZ0_9FLAO|nr:sulfite exporter TauE/SafE family protein [Phaeocystidibacter luteus]KAB2814181.1 sulfite exporter TauE/SafE family protein [Phaeocystidibacter luteus]